LTLAAGCSSRESRRGLSAAGAASIPSRIVRAAWRSKSAPLASVHIDEPITIERIAMADQLLDEVRAVDAARVEVRRRHITALEASKTTVTEVFGIGPLMAAIIVGRVGDVRRFPSAGHFARHNGTAPIEASSGPTKRHRLNPRGDRQLNHAIHMAAVTQVRNDTPGRAAYYLRKQAEGKSRKEALRALKRRISDAIYQRLLADADR
jgi:transposase